MRIFLASMHSINAALPSSRIWDINLRQPLLDLGHEVIRFNYDFGPHLSFADPDVDGYSAFVETYQPRLENALLQQLEAEHRQEPVDVFLSYFYSAFCRPEKIREIGRLGIRTINWYCNGSYQFDLVADIAPAYDYCLVPEKFRLADYRRVGANPIYFQEAANPNYYKPYPLKRNLDVTFVGQCYGDRPAYIRYLYDQGIDVRVRGCGWLPAHPSQTRSGLSEAVEFLGTLHREDAWRTLGRRLKAAVTPARFVETTVADTRLPLALLGPPLSDDEMVRMYSRSKISLGFSSCGETHRAGERVLQIRLRDFEGPMSGAFYLVEYMEELEEFFDIGKEIVCYRDRADLAEKVRYYLTHEDQRERIRTAGRRRALAEHTWQKRFENLFRQIGLG